MVSPARNAPSSAIGYCRTFGSMIAIRSPRCSFALCCSQAAKSRARLS
jgi:hypothetical protein